MNIDPDLLERPLRRLALVDDDLGADWILLMPVLLRHYNLTPDAYWNLTGHEALALYEHLLREGVADGPE